MANAQILSLTLHNPVAHVARSNAWERNVGHINLALAQIRRLGDQQNFGLSRQCSCRATTLTVNGTGFTGSSIVMWNGSSRITTFSSATQLTAAITAADLGAGSVAQVSVNDGANTSNSLPFNRDWSGADDFERIANQRASEFAKHTDHRDGKRISGQTPK